MADDLDKQIREAKEAAERDAQFYRSLYEAERKAREAEAAQKWFACSIKAVFTILLTVVVMAKFSDLNVSCIFYAPLVCVCVLFPVISLRHVFGLVFDGTTWTRRSFWLSILVLVVLASVVLFFIT